MLVHYAKARSKYSSSLCGIRHAGVTTTNDDEVTCNHCKDMRELGAD